MVRRMLEVELSGKRRKGSMAPPWIRELFKLNPGHEQFILNPLKFIFILTKP